MPEDNKKREAFKNMTDMEMKDMIHSIHFHVNDIFASWSENQIESKTALDCIRRLDAFNKLRF